MKTKNRNIIIGLLTIGIGLILIFGIKWISELVQTNSSGDKSYSIDTNRITDYYWHTDYDTISNSEYLIRGKLLDSISQSPNELIEILNLRPVKCKIDYVELIGDTIVIRILEDEYLTERMGTAGADCYLAETIYTLTENDSIQFVRFEMDYGSHAGPGLFSRNDYERMIKE